MARGTIKTTTTGNAGGGTTNVSITVSATGATGSTTQGMTTPPGQVMSGTLQDEGGTVYPFSQSFGAELGLQVGLKVNYQLATCNGQTMANCVRLIGRGVIASIFPATDPSGNDGTLTDKATGQIMNFAQVCAASTLAVGTKVNFERIINPLNGQLTAVALEVAQ